MNKMIFVYLFLIWIITLIIDLSYVKYFDICDSHNEEGSVEVGIIYMFSPIALIILMVHYITTKIIPTIHNIIKIIY